MTKKKKKKTDDIYYGLEGYVPADFSPKIAQNKINQIPPYEDSGIRFQGYSKRNTGSGQYQLFPQQRFFIQDNQSNTLDVQTATIIPENRSLFVSSIWFSGTAGTATDSWDLMDGSLLIGTFQNFSNHQEQIIFDPPIKFSNSVKWVMNQTLVQLFLNVFGWLE